MTILSKIKTLSYLFKGRPFNLERPVVLQFPVNDICNSRCQMCRIWENKKSEDLTPEQLRAGLRNPLFSNVMAVGLNGGEPTLRKDLGQLVAILFEELPKLESISLITNAYKYDEVIARINDVGRVVKEHGGNLDVMISLDGFAEVHDKVRGKPNNFERAQHVIEFVKNSTLVNSVRIGCTIIKDNVFGLSDLFEFCQSKGLYIKYRLGIPHQRLYTQNLIDPYSLNAEEKYYIVEFLEGLIIHYETSEAQNFFYRSLIDQIIDKAPRKAGCDWQHRGATITSKGDLLYCAVQSKVLGNITVHNSEKKYFGNKDHLKDIISNNCDSCNHDYMGIPPRKQQAKQLVIRIAKKFHAEKLLIGTYHYFFKVNLSRILVFMNGLFPSNIATQDWPGIGNGKRVLICGWYGTETLGDKAILGGILISLRKCLGDINVVLVSLHPYVSKMTRRQMNELKGVRIVNCEQGAKLANQADLVVFAGGPLMAIDETTNMLAIFESAKKAGQKTIVAGCGVGPLGARRHNAAIKRILQLADVRIYRDQKSRQISAKLGINVDSDLVSEDPAFTWLEKQREELKKQEYLCAPKILLLGLRDFPHATYARHLSESASLEAKLRYEASVQKALEQLVEQHQDLVIRPLPMCTNHFGDDDRWFYRRLFRGNKKLESHLDFSLLNAELNPVDYCKAFKQSTVALTMRFHSVVFAMGLDVPAVAIDYTLGQGKVYALAERFDIPCRNLIDLDADFIVREVSLLLKKPRPQITNFTLSFPSLIRTALEKLDFEIAT